MKKVLIATLLLVATIALGATNPSWVANIPGTGFVPCYDSAATEGGLSTIEVTATADLTFSVWTYDGSSWTKVSPKWWVGATAADSVLFVPAGVTRLR